MVFTDNAFNFSSLFVYLSLFSKLLLAPAYYNYIYNGVISNCSKCTHFNRARSRPSMSDGVVKLFQYERLRKNLSKIFCKYSCFLTIHFRTNLVLSITLLVFNGSSTASANKAFIGVDFMQPNMTLNAWYCKRY